MESEQSENWFGKITWVSHLPHEDHFHLVLIFVSNVCSKFKPEKNKNKKKTR